MTTNENRKGPSAKQKDIKSEYIQKLSNEKALAEAVLIGNKPSLIVVDFTNSDSANDSDIRIGVMESIAYNGGDTRLKPELLSNRPYSFRNREEFNAFIEKARNETLDSLFDKTLSIWRKYINADDFHLKICAADTMYTYRQDKIGTTHYLFFVADNDAGKSNNLKLLNILAYRNLMNNSMTHANIYHFLGSKDEGPGTICIDEADNIDQYPEIMAILKSGYTKGIPVVRIIESAGIRRQVRFNTYCFKALAGERLPDEVECRGFMQRTIVIKCVPGFVKDDISEITDPAGDNDYENLLNELNDLRNLLFCHRLIHFNDKIPNINLNIHNREKQLFKPLLRMFQGTRTFDTLRPVISKYINERRESKANSLHAFIYRIIRDLIKSKGTFELDFSDIWNFIKSNVEWKDIQYKAQSIETVEFGIISQKQVGSILRNIFGAKPPKHTGSSRRLVFKQHVMDRMKDVYETVDVNVDLETSESLDEHTKLGFGTDGTVGTLSGGMDTDIDTLNDGENTENNEDNDKNLEEIDLESRNNNSIKKFEGGALSEKLSQVSQVSQTPKINTNQYQTEGTNPNSNVSQVSQIQTQTRPYSDYLIDGVPIWQVEKRGMTVEEAEAFKEEVERLSRERDKDKTNPLAESAKANTSGNGIMFGKDKGEEA